MKGKLAAFLLAATPAFAQCNNDWSPVGTGTDGDVNALQVFGGLLYAGGAFTHAGGGAAAHIATWNGSSWSTLGAGRPENVLALTTYATGGHQVLVAAGDLPFPGSSIAFCDGAAWTAPTEGAATSSWIGAVGSFDGGQGPELFASGGFGNYVSRWSAAAGWREVGSGLSTVVWAFQVHDDGRGPALFLVGDLTVNGLPDSGGVARWDGQQWSTVGGGLSQIGEGRAAAVFDDGHGPALYIGGRFARAGTTSVTNIARWDGQNWTPLGSGISGPNFNAEVRALAVFDDGDGPTLYAAGSFNNAGGVAVNNIARWRNGAWSSVGAGFGGEVYALAIYDADGSGPQPASLYAAGAFTTAGGGPAAHIAVWHGCGCYANCDASVMPPVLNINDFVCFQARFAAGDTRANCDGSSGIPVLTVNDFVCFQGRFVAGCG